MSSILSAFYGPGDLYVMIHIRPQIMKGYVEEWKKVGTEEADFPSLEEANFYQELRKRFFARNFLNITFLVSSIGGALSMGLLGTSLLSTALVINAIVMVSWGLFRLAQNLLSIDPILHKMGMQIACLERLV